MPVRSQFHTVGAPLYATFQEGLLRITDSLKDEVFLTLATPWTVAHQAHLSMGFPRKEYWSRLPFPLPRDLLVPREKTPTGAAARGNPLDAPVLAS